MENRFIEIVNLFNDYATLNNSQRELLKQELVEFATENRDFFTKAIQSIEPTEESILFEVYESLSIHPEEWVDFVVNEIYRIRKATEDAYNEDRPSTVYPLMAMSFYTTLDFPGKYKLVDAIYSTLKSHVKEIKLVCLGLLGDLYLHDKAKYHNCRFTIETYKGSENPELSEYVDQLIKSFDEDNPQPSETDENSITDKVKEVFGKLMESFKKK